MQQQQQPQVKKASPFVCLSAQCALLDRLGLRPHAYGVISAQTVLRRGWEGLSFNTPPPAAAVAAAADEAEAPSIPSVVVAALPQSLSGSALFYGNHSASTTRTTTAAAASTSSPVVVEGSAIEAASLLCQQHFGKLAADVSAAAPEEGPRGSRAKAEAERVSAAAVSVPARAPLSGQPLSIVLPSALVRRTLLQVLLILRLPGRSPAAVFTVCRSVSSLPPSAASLAAESVRFRVAPRVSWAGSQPQSPCDGEGDGGLGSFEYEVGVTANTDSSAVFPLRRKRARDEEMATSEWLAAEPLPSLQCRTVSQKGETVILAEVDPSSLPASSTDAQWQSHGGLVSDILFQHPFLFPTAEATSSSSERPTLKGGVARIAALVGEGAESSPDLHVVATMLRYAQTQRAAEGTPTIPAGSLLAFLQRGCFTLLSFLAHLSWCRLLAGVLQRRLRDAAAAADGLSDVRAFLYADAMRETPWEDAVRGGAVFTEPSEEGFSSLLLAAHCVTDGSEPCSALPKIRLDGGKKGGGAVRGCVVRVTAARDQLRWKLLSVAADRSATPSWEVEERTGTLSELLRTWPPRS